MPVELHSPSGPGGNESSLQSARVGGSKPLHRFLRARPKIIGVIVLVLGASFAIVSIALNVYPVHYIWTVVPRGLLLGSLSFTSGTLFILTEHKPSKRTVTASLALSIMTILAAIWNLFHTVPEFYHRNYYISFVNYYSNVTKTDKQWRSHIQAMGLAVEVVNTLYTVAGGVLFIVMASLGVAALRTTKSQAVVVMTVADTDEPVE